MYRVVTKGGLQLANLTDNKILGHLVAGGFIPLLSRRGEGLNKEKGKLVKYIGICGQPSFKVVVFSSGGCIVENLVEHGLILKDDNVLYI